MNSISIEEKKDIFDFKLKWNIQSHEQGGNVSDYLSFEGKSLTGLILAGSMGNSSMIFKQAVVGAADPWLSINYSNNGLYTDGVHKTGIGKTVALSIMGGFGPIYQVVPIFKSGAPNFLTEQLLMAPSQKVLTNEK